MLRHWHSVRDTGDIQFAPLPAAAPQPPSPPPEWLTALGNWLKHLFDPAAQALGASWPMVQKLGIGLGALLLLAMVWHLMRPLIAKRRTRAAADDDAWLPPAAEALALLDEADRLAGAGRFDEATHLLLRRSIQHIAEARPEWLHPASTAREIARLPALSAAARDTFATITALVEASRYALRPLGQADWQTARNAYAAFATARIIAA